jgi:exportin-1
MKVLKILSEEIFDSEKNNLTASRRSNLKETMNSEFSKIYELCDWVLTTAVNYHGQI